MSNSNVKYYLDDSFGEEEKVPEKLSKQVELIIELYTLLKIEDKVKVKQILRDKDIWN
jgi:hypothetical protein